MNYFTPEWHRGDIDEHPGKKYQDYLAPLLPQWPRDVRRLANNINLHDGLIREFAWDTLKGTLFLRLRCGDLQVGYFDLDLHYSGVPFSPPDRASLLTLNASKFSSALYDEVDEEEGYFIHRILFISRERTKDGWFEYYEAAIRFQQLRLVTTPCESRSNASTNANTNASR